MKGNTFQSPEDFEKEMTPVFARREENTRKQIQKLEDRRWKNLLKKKNEAQLEEYLTKMNITI